MRFGLIPQSPPEEALLNDAPHTRVLLEPFLAIATAQSLMAFVRTGLAAAMTDAPRTPQDLADELDLRSEGAEHLLHVLAAAGYVELVSGSGKAYSLTPLSRAVLLRDSPARLDAWILHNAVHQRVLAGMDETLRRDGARDLHHRLESAKEWSIYQRAMLQTAKPVAPAVAERIPEPAGRGLLLDLGGSHGLYGAAICRRYAPMRSRVIDLPEAIEAARALGVEEGLGELVEYEAADLLVTDFGRGVCDIVFLGNVIHHVDEDRLPEFLERAHDALRPGGVIAIWDMAPAPAGGPPDLVSASFSLLFHLASAAACRPPEQQAALLTDAGFRNAEVHDGISPTHGLITATR